MTLYGALLRLYPASFRGEYGAEMAALHAERRRRTRGPGLVALWLSAVLDVGRGAAAAHADLLGQDLRFTARCWRRSPGLAVTARRLHDTGRSGWWMLLSFVPFGGLVLLVFTLQDSRGPNAWGQSPKALAAQPA